MITRRYRQQIEADNTKSLEKDVMFFLAIIMLCLLAIFALVQALPMADYDHSGDLATRELLQKQLEGLKKELKNLAVELRILEKKRQEKVVEIEGMEESLRSAGQKNKRRRQDISANLEKLAELKAGIESSRIQLEEITAKVQVAGQRLQNQENRFQLVSQELIDARSKTDRLREQLYHLQNRIREERKTTEPDIITSPSSPEEGLSIAISSAAQIALMKKNMVHIFMDVGGKIFELYRSYSSGWQFRPVAEYPVNSYVFPDENDVARSFVEAGRGSVISRKERRYYISLSSATDSRIRELIRSKNIGVIKIDERGEVLYVAPPSH